MPRIRTVGVLLVLLMLVLTLSYLVSGLADLLPVLSLLTFFTVLVWFYIYTRPGSASERVYV